MKTGIILLTFKQSATPEDIQAAVDVFYIENKCMLENMEYNEFEDPDILSDLKSNIRELAAEKKHLKHTVIPNKADKDREERILKNDIDRNKARSNHEEESR